ncbi:MAG: hypothetical protein JWM87_1053 [Candidatus Eremiobacteraeota bacterium]|nr:hypothetical protein [Candidatus Eremiobacteraeota bacterium]
MRAAELDDADDPRPVRIPLSVNDPNAGRTLTRSVERILHDGRRCAPVVVELYGNTLPASLIAVLIGNLRRVREVGGVLSVNASSPELRHAIALHGLDRVLGDAVHPGRSAASRSRAKQVAEAAWPVFALFILTLTVATVAILMQLNPGFGNL